MAGYGRSKKQRYLDHREPAISLSEILPLDMPQLASWFYICKAIPSPLSKYIAKLSYHHHLSETDHEGHHESEQSSSLSKGETQDSIRE